jgi:nitrate reductase NapA
MELERRQFLKGVALAVASAALSGPAAWAVSDPADGLKWEKAPCRFCGTGCGVLVGVKGGKIVAMRGDASNPVNRGLLCVKGYHVGSILYGKDRLTQPMIRRDPAGELEPCSWDEAIDAVARFIMERPKEFGFYGSGQWTIVEGYTALKFMKGGLGSNEIDPNARLCMASAVTGFLSTFGVDEPAGCYDDFDETDAVVCWGNNFAETHPVLFSRVVDRKARGENVQLIDIGARRTRTTDRADLYLEFTPQTDLAIANCVAWQIFENNAVDRKFTDAHVRFMSGPDMDGEDISIEQYREFLQDYTVEKVAKLSGAPEVKLRELGALFCDPNKKVVSLWCMGVNQHTRGTWMNNLIYNIHLLTGKICEAGSAPLSLTGQPSACGTCREVGTLCHALPGGRVVLNDEHRAETEDIWNVPRGRIPAKPGHHAVAMFKALESGDLKGAWVQVTNPAQSIPNLNQNMTRMRERFLVVSDVYPTATTRLARVTLPSAMWVEKNGIFGNTERRTQQWFKMVEPPGQARDDAWQTLAVARRLYDLGFEGMKDRDGNFLFAVRDENGNEVEAWKWEVFREFNFDKALFEEYRQFTTKKHKNLAPYDEYAKAPGLRWPVAQDEKTGEWRETSRRFAAPWDPFAAKGQKADFYHAKKGDGRAIVWARPYEAPPESPDAEYPFWLSTGRVLEHWHTGTMTRRVPELSAAMPNAYAEISRDDAQRLGLRSGDMVRLVSRRGRLEVPVWVGGRGAPPPGTVFVPFFDEERMVNMLTLDAWCPLSKEPDYKKCAVRVEKAVA